MQWLVARHVVERHGEPDIRMASTGRGAGGDTRVWKGTEGLEGGEATGYTRWWVQSGDIQVTKQVSQPATLARSCEYTCVSARRFRLLLASRTVPDGRACETGYRFAAVAVQDAKRTVSLVSPMCLHLREVCNFLSGQCPQALASLVYCFSSHRETNFHRTGNPE